MSAETAERLRRALDLQRGRSGRECRTPEHQAEVEQLAQLPADELRARLVALHVRIDPPARERVCSCEVE